MREVAAPLLAATRGAQQERSKRRQRVSCAEQGALAGHELAPAADEDTFVVLKGAPSRPPQASVISCCLCGARYEGYVIQIRSSLAVRLATPFVDWAPCRGGRICVCYASQDRKEILAKAKAAASSTMGYDGKISDHATIGYAPKRWVVSIVFL